MNLGTQKCTKQNRANRVKQAQKLVTEGYSKYRAALIMSVKPNEVKVDTNANKRL